jgi:hypothetical protein
MTPRLFSMAVSLLVAVLASSEKSHAAASNKNGNPFGNGTFFQTTGTFSAVVRGQNLSGTMLFSSGVNNSTNNATNSSGGTTTISYLGGGSSDISRAGIYIGNAAGFWDPSSGSITGQLWGGLSLSRTNSASIYPEIYNTNTYPVLIQTESNVVIPPQIVLNPVTGGANVIPGTNFVITNNIYVMPVGNNSFNDTAYMSGNFSGNTANSYPNQTFTAQGMLVQQQLAPQSTTTTIVTNANGVVSTNVSPNATEPVSMAPDLQIPITVQGIRVSDSYSTFNTVSNSVPYSWTTYSVTNFAGFGQVQ